MDIKDLNPGTFADMFATPGETQKAAGLNFGMQESEQDLFNVGLETANLTEGIGVVHSSTVTETTTEAPDSNKSPEELEADKNTKTGKDVDILGDGKTEPPKDKPAEELKGISDYFKKRMEEGKFVAVNDVDDKGNTVPFIPKTAEEFDEVIEMQINYKFEQAKKDLDKQWYEGKSPAWKAVSQYAEMIDNPAQLIPFLQGVKTIQSVASFDENESDGAEQIIRVRLEQSGDPDEVIDAQIEALKTTGKLIDSAKQIKPLIIQQEQQALANQVKIERQRNQEHLSLINTIREGAYKAIEQPIFGKQKLKQDEKAAIYDLIGQPSQETQGYAIYSEIDKLFDNKDFATLTQLALLIAKKDSFFNYLGTDIANKTAAGLQRKLQLATDSRKTSGNDYDEEKVATVNRPRFNNPLRFGASEK